MKIVLCHNHYRHRGGEDQVFADETRMLEEYGHDVVRFERDNATIDDMSKPGVAARALWNHGTYRELRAVLRRERPAIVHCTNAFPLLSPSIYFAARAEGVAVVQSLHNYRLICPSATLFRDGRVCEECLGKAVPWPSVLHGCYQHGRASNAIVTMMLATHRALRTWGRAVDLFVTPSSFARAKLVEGGLDPDRIAVKPNFVSQDPGIGDGEGAFAVFVGRLSPEKGLDTLLRCWSRLDRDIPLKIVGDGPLMDMVQAATQIHPRIEAVGRRPQADVYEIVKRAAFLVMPSQTYETFGRAIIEAFAVGTPVIAARHGAMAELVSEGRTGLHFTPGDADDLGAKVKWLTDHTTERVVMRKAVRREYETQYTAAVNHERLMTLYQWVLHSRAGGERHPRVMTDHLRAEAFAPRSLARKPTTRSIDTRVP